MPQHPGEQHIRGEMMKAINDHFSSAELMIDGVSYTFDWAYPAMPGQAHGLCVLAPDGTEVARYHLSANAMKVPVPVAKPEPEWVAGAWLDVRAGYCVKDPSGSNWEVISVSANTVTIAQGDKSYEFTPRPDQPVTYLKGCV